MNPVAFIRRFFIITCFSTAPAPAEELVPLGRKSSCIAPCAGSGANVASALAIDEHKRCTQEQEKAQAEQDQAIAEGDAVLTELGAINIGREYQVDGTAP